MTESYFCANKHCIWLGIAMYTIITILIGFNFGIEPIVLPAGNQLTENFEIVKHYQSHDQTTCDFYGTKCEELVNNQCLMNNLCFSSNNSYINKTLNNYQNIGGVALMNPKGYEAVNISTSIAFVLVIFLIAVGSYKACLRERSCERENRHRCKITCTCFHKKLNFSLFQHLNIFVLTVIIFLFIIPSLKWMMTEKEQDWIITSDQFKNTHFSSKGFISHCKNNLYIIDPTENVSDQCYKVNGHWDNICCISDLVELNDDAKKLYPSVVEYTKVINKFAFSTILTTELILFCIFMIPFIVDLCFFASELNKAYQNRVNESRVYNNVMDNDGLNDGLDYQNSKV